MSNGHKAYVLRMSKASMRIYHVCMLHTSSHLQVFGIAIEMESKLDAMEARMSRPK
jgi:hypothetical protein